LPGMRALRALTATLLLGPFLCPRQASCVDNRSPQMFLEAKACVQQNACWSDMRSLLVLYHDGRFAILTTYFDRDTAGGVTFQPSEGCVIYLGEWSPTSSGIIAQNKGRWAYMAVGKPKQPLAHVAMHWQVTRNSEGKFTSISDSERQYKPVSLLNPEDVKVFVGQALRESATAGRRSGSKRGPL
jgi:hypothetical protein